MCACVSSTQSMVAGSTVSLSQFRCRRSLDPSKSPQSTSSRLPSASNRYFDPVTVPAAPRKVIFGIGADSTIDDLFSASSFDGYQKLARSPRGLNEPTLGRITCITNGRRAFTWVLVNHTEELAPLRLPVQSEIQAIQSRRQRSDRDLPRGIGRDARLETDLGGGRFSHRSIIEVVDSQLPQAFHLLVGPPDDYDRHRALFARKFPRRPQREDGLIADFCEI